MYSYWRRITIDNAKVGEDDADFAFLFNSTLADLATVGNGGRVENTDASGGASGALTVPADLVFAAQADGSGKYDFEVEKYDAATGELIAWVQSGVSSATDTVLYLIYGDKEVTTTQENVPGTWDTNFKGLWHLAETSGAHHDSTSEGNDSTAMSVATQGSAVGKVDGADEFDGDADYIGLGDIDSGLFDGVNDLLTIEAWINGDSLTGNHTIISKFDFLPSSHRTTFWFYIDDGELLVRVYKTDDPTQGIDFVTDTASLGAGALHHVVVAIDLGNTNSEMEFYANGQSEAATRTVGGTPPTVFGENTAPVEIGALHNHSVLAPHCVSFDGVIDEVRLSKSVRSANYTTTCYNNQNSPATFYGVSEPDRVRPVDTTSLPNLMIA